MGPRRIPERNLSGLLRQIHDGLDDVMYTMHQVESIVHEARKMAPVWRQLRDAAGTQAGAEEDGFRDGEAELWTQSRRTRRGRR